MPSPVAFDIPSSADSGERLPGFLRRVRELNGTAARGEFAVPLPGFGRFVRGKYSSSGGGVRVEVLERPGYLPGDVIRAALADGLDTDEPDAPQVSPFHIDVRFLGGLTPTQQDVFMLAAGRWSRIVTADLPDVRLPSGEVVDDVLINAGGVFIDGDGMVLGRAGPTALRPGSMLPATGMMEFDTADLSRMEMEGTLENVIVHEMGHVLGIGSLWGAGLFNFVRGTGGRNPLYAGPNAAREFAKLLGETVPRPVPVENMGGPGTAGAHWRESVFLNELMTGFLNAGRNPLSRVTVGALEDLGYRVDYGAADGYALPDLRAVQLQGDAAHLEQCNCPVMLRPKPVILPESSMI